MLLSVLLLLAALTVLPTGCMRQRANDEESIKTVLGTSEYMNDDHSGATDDETSNPRRDGYGPGNEGDFVPLDTLPFVRFCRMIERPVPRTVVISIPAYPGYPETTALAVITATPSGQFYVHNDRTSHVAWVKDFTDQGVRKVYLTRHDDTWRIRRLTPWNISTQNAPYNVDLASVRLEARPSGLNYLYTSPDTLLTKQQLPAFLPGDTVKVTVTIQCDSGAWTFLHRGRRGHHIRQAFYRSSPTTFEREWRIWDDSLPPLPVVRPTATDVIAWPTLFGDSSAAYNAHAWTLPYVILEHPDAVRP
jgi:hypothetical protein